MTAPVNRIEGSILAHLPVKLWRVEVETHADDGEELLSNEERARAARFSFQRDRLRYVRSHKALRRVLGAECGVCPSRLQIETGPFGKPYLPGFPGLHFNLSHSGDVAVVACCTGFPVGVDIEECRPMPDAIELAAQHAPDAELLSLCEKVGQERLQSFFLMWTRREACLKAIGCGFGVPLPRFPVGLDEAEQIVMVQSDGGLRRLQVASAIFGTITVSVALDLGHASGRQAPRSSLNVA